MIQKVSQTTIQSSNCANADNTNKQTHGRHRREYHKQRNKQTTASMCNTILALYLPHPPRCFPFPIASGRGPPPKKSHIAGLSAKPYHAVQGCSTFNHVSNPVTVNTGAVHTGAVKTGTNTSTNTGTTKSTVAPGNPQARGTHLCTCPPNPH